METEVQIKELATITELLCTHRAHERLLDHIHLAASWTSLDQLVRQRPAEQQCLGGAAPERHAPQSAKVKKGKTDFPLIGSGAPERCAPQGVEGQPDETDFPLIGGAAPERRAPKSAKENTIWNARGHHGEETSMKKAVSDIRGNKNSMEKFEPHL